jgi:tetratricopeptide (TPR) repeat protein
MLTATTPDQFDALHARGLNELQQGNYEAGANLISAALRANPASVEAWANLGLALGALERHDEAVASFDQALAIKPDFAEVLCSRAVALGRLGRHDQALAGFERALAVRPDWADALSNRGVALVNLNRQAEAIAAFQRATAIEPDHPDANCNESLAWLRLGDFRRGWAKYETRWASRDLASQRRDFARPLWLGDETLQGKTILLHAEQGLGDTVQFVRYAPLVAGLGAQVVLEAQPALVALLSGIGGISRIVGKGEPLPEFDVHCPLLSLPLALKTDLDSIPAAVPYLAAPDVRAATWRDRLGPRLSPRVGIAWAGSRTNRNDYNRSIALGPLASSLQIPGVELVSIQKDVSEADRELLRANPHIRHVGDELEDFGDTAAVMSQLDLVISVDTSVAHLAGAMALPLWLLVPFAPDFRWMLDREDSPWYPTARLFRQRQIGDWDGVLARIRNALVAWAEQSRRR